MPVLNFFFFYGLFCDYHTTKSLQKCEKNMAYSLTQGFTRYLFHFSAEFSTVWQQCIRSADATVTPSRGNDEILALRTVREQGNYQNSSQ